MPRRGAAGAVAIGRAFGRGVGALLVAATAVLMIGSAVAAFWLHVGTQPVLSGSMTPTFRPGAAVFTRPMPVRDVRPGDVIVFLPPGHTESFAHRVVTVSGDPAHPTVTTKGDANPVPDAWHAKLLGAEVPKVVGSMPFLGRLIVAVHGQSARVGLGAAAGLFVCVFGTRLILATKPAGARRGGRTGHRPGARLTGPVPMG